MVIAEINAVVLILGLVASPRAAETASRDDALAEPAPALPAVPSSPQAATDKERVLGSPVSASGQGVVGEGLDPELAPLPTVATRVPAQAPPPATPELLGTKM